MFFISREEAGTILRDYGINAGIRALTELQRYHYEQDDPDSREVRLIVHDHEHSDKTSPRMQCKRSTAYGGLLSLIRFCCHCWQQPQHRSSTAAKNVTVPLIRLTGMRSLALWIRPRCSLVSGMPLKRNTWSQNLE